MSKPGIVFIIVIFSISISFVVPSVGFTMHIGSNVAKKNSSDSLYGFLTLEDYDVWVEFSVSPGLYLLTCEFRNLVDRSSYIYIYVYEYVRVYSPVLGKMVWLWKEHNKYLLSLYGPIIGYYEYDIFVRAEGKIAIHIVGTSVRRVEYNVSFDKVLSFDELNRIGYGAEYNFEENQRYLGFYDEEYAMFNISILQTTYNVPKKYRYIYLRPIISDLDDSETIEIYWNDTYVGYADKYRYDIKRIMNPEMGNYIVKLKFTNQTRSDGVKIIHLEIYSLIEGDTNIYYSSKFIDMDLNSTNNIGEVNITLSESNKTTKVDYVVFDPSTGRKTTFTLNGNDTVSSLIYINGTRYIFIKKYIGYAKLNFKISLEMVEFHEVFEGTPVTAILNQPNEVVPLLIHVPEGYYYNLSIKILADANWSITLWDEDGNYLAGYDALKNASNVTRRLVFIHWQKNNMTGPLTAEYPYYSKAIGTRIEYINMSIDRVSKWESTYEYPFIMAYITGCNYSMGIASVDIWLIREKEIQSLELNEEVEVELNESSFERYEIFYTNISIGIEYILNVSPTEIISGGYVSSKMYMPSKLWAIGFLLTDYTSRLFGGPETQPLILETTTNINGRAIIEVYSSSFSGKVKVLLRENRPAEDRSIEWSVKYGDFLKMIELDVKIGKTYSIKLKSDRPVISAFSAISDDGSFPSFMQIGDYIEYVDDWPIIFMTYESELNTTIDITFNHNGKIYLMLIVYQNHANITIEIKDTTPLTINYYIWLPIGIAIGAIATIAIIKIYQYRERKHG